MLARKVLIVLLIVAGAVAVVSSVAYVSTMGTGGSASGGLPNPYTNRAYGFMVQYPQGWKGYENYKLDSNTSSVVTFVGPNASISIVAYTIPFGQSFDSIDASSKQANLGQHKGYTMNLQSEGVGTLSGIPTHVRVWIKKTPQGDYQEETLHFANQGRIYSIGFVTPSSLYNDQVGLFNQFLKSFSFI